MTLVMSRTPSPRCTRQPLWLVAAGVFVLAAAACTGGANVTTTTSPATEGGGEEVSTTEADATVTLGAETCSSTIPETWVKREMIIELVADTDSLLHFAAGTYREGHSRAELLALGTRLSAAPPVFVMLHYHEHANMGSPNVVRLEFDEPGRYWMVCFDDRDIDVVFPDVIVEG